MNELIRRILFSSIGKKILVGVTGVLLCGFLISHLAGNLFLLVGEEAFNHYAETLAHNPFILPAELALLAVFLAHIAVAAVVSIQNKAARPVAYEVQRSKGGSTVGSRTMVYSGVLLFVFLVVHIKTFKYGDVGPGLYHLVLTSFQNPFYTAFYVLAMAAAGLHLSHGAQSAFQTLGINHPRYTPLIKAAGWVFAAGISLGFASLPLWAYFRTGGLP
ncbi:MAG: succinate dehydrogenase cytochrome b subunit [Elusimicrobia bacterium]|nr:succinate dehydrogenase cytochrome b subunit [Elusimicrobiota bacterium]